VARVTNNSVRYGYSRPRAADRTTRSASLTERGITPCISPRSIRNVQIECDEPLYRRHHKFENVFRIEDWRGIGTRYARCAHFMPSPSPQPSAIGSDQSALNLVLLASAKITCFHN
jgi:hypothetical protein